MAGYSCKMCGGTLDITEGLSVCECQYCGSKQTLPKLSDEKKNNLYDRASHFRRNNEYDKAMAIYEQILNEDTEDAESYWSLVLCTYGIEYVEDPVTKKRVPTINRAQMTSIYADENYKSALRYADTMQKLLYEEEAKEIERIQKGIFEISGKEEPFDIFICYKESDANGRRTPDSVLANELYYQLIQEGFKVFFSRITLEDKLGSAYEPYIFAALNSAKVMVVLGTKPEYFNAVWVRNEWSRYLALIKQGANKILIPAYRDMDPYDLPDEMAYLQAQDMSKLGFMQDLIRGIKKITGQDNKPIISQTTTNLQSQNVTTTEQQGAVSGNGAQALVDRAFLFLEDGEFDRADELCEQALNQDPKNAMAYVGKLMVEKKLRTQNALSEGTLELTENNYFQKAVRFAEEGLKNELNRCNQMIMDRNKDITYEEINKMIRENGVAGGYEAAIKVLDNAIARYEAMLGWRDSENKIKECREKKEQLITDNKNNVYQRATDLVEEISSKLHVFSEENISADQIRIAYYDAMKKLDNAISSYKQLDDWKNSVTQIAACEEIKESIKHVLYQNAQTLISQIPQKLTKKSKSELVKASSILKILDTYKDSSAVRKNIQKRVNNTNIKQYIKNLLLVIVFVGAIIAASIWFNSEIMPDMKVYSYQDYLKDGFPSELKIPSYVEKIDVSFNSNLVSIKLPSNLKEIKADTFSNCIYLTNVDIPNGVTIIGDNAFRGCKSLTSIEMPDKLVSIGKAAFENCSSLTSIEIPFRVESIGARAFKGCTNLINIETHSNVTVIGEEVFSDCTSLTSIEIPFKVWSIGMNAFYGCTSLTNVFLPHSLEWVGTNAFAGCTNLKKISAPRDSYAEIWALSYGYEVQYR